MLKLSDYKWQSAQAERLYDESARVVATGWSDVEMYGADCLKQSHHRFAVAVKNLEQALKLEGDTVHPLIYKELSRAYAALALYHYDIRPKRDLAQTYALHSTRAGKEAIARYDKSVGWDRQCRSGFHLALAIACVCCRDPAAADYHLAVARRFGEVGSMGETWHRRSADLRRKAGAHKGDRRCFVASAAIGSGCAPEVDLLRRFRDEALLCTGWGRAAVAVYYLVGPLLARLISASTVLRRCAEVLLVRPAARLAGCWLATASSRFGLGPSRCG